MQCKHLCLLQHDQSRGVCGLTAALTVCLCDGSEVWCLTSAKLGHSVLPGDGCSLGVGCSERGIGMTGMPRAPARRSLGGLGGLPRGVCLALCPLQGCCHGPGLPGRPALPSHPGLQHRVSLLMVSAP